MRRKDIRHIVRAMHSTKPTKYTSQLLVAYDLQWEYDVIALGDIISQINPRFDFTRFVKECKEGIPDDVLPESKAV